jgi:hypothetical protein
MVSNGNTLTGPDCDVWGTVLAEDSHAGDLVVLKPRVASDASDAFSRIMSRYAIPLVEMFVPERWRRVDERFGDLVVREDVVFGIALCITGFVAAVVPVLPISTLMNVKGSDARLGVIAGFNLGFVRCMLRFTDAKRKELFVGTAV